MTKSKGLMTEVLTSHGIKLPLHFKRHMRNLKGSRGRVTWANKSQIVKETSYF